MPQSIFRCVPDRQSSFCNAFLASARVRDGFPICHKTSEDFARVTHHRQSCSLVSDFKVALRLACIIRMMVFETSIPMTSSPVLQYVRCQSLSLDNFCAAIQHIERASWVQMLVFFFSKTGGRLGMCAGTGPRGLGTGLGWFLCLGLLCTNL